MKWHDAVFAVVNTNAECNSEPLVPQIFGLVHGQVGSNHSDPMRRYLSNRCRPPFSELIDCRDPPENRKFGSIGTLI